MTTVVWFKRDLRTRDHAPLVAAANLGEPVIALYVIEDDYWQQPDTSGRQWCFIRDSLEDLDKQLRKAGNQLVVLRGTVIGALSELKASHAIERVFCHQETGGQWTFERDKAVIQWCSDNQIEFREWHQFGVVRRLKDRDIWDKTWTELMRQPVLEAPGSVPFAGAIQGVAWRGIEPGATAADRCPDRQTGGSIRGETLLASFLERRCVGYQYNISSPNTAVRACSRLSPHIAYGTVSLREIYQQAKAAGIHRNTLPRKQKSLTSFRSRLHWREPALHLARLFTDFEPGIHYSQTQMQSGLTGINALRIYNPVLQSQKLDPHGEFIRRWIPELAGVPEEMIHTPWLMTPAQKAKFGGNTYIAPVCDHEQAARAARKAVGDFRKQHVSREETGRVLHRHGSRKGSHQTRPKSASQPPPDNQLSLFD
jgi:deoxyribodipyrimidine photolyase